MRHLIALLAPLLLASAAFGQTGIITTVAGGGPGNLPALEANIAVPTALARDSAGNLYVTSITQDRVFKIDTAGILIVLAGDGFAGFAGDGGPAPAAKLNNPQGVAVDSAGNVFIADRDNHRIRRVDAATGIITTVAGTGTSGFNGDGIPATSAHLRVPAGVAVDLAGNLYIADQSNQRIRRVDAGTGLISTFAGTGVAGFSGDGGPATNATLRNPTDVALDGSGNLYFCDANNHRIRRVDAAGTITSVAGNGAAAFGGDGGPATAASLNVPLGLDLDDAGNIFIADQLNRRIRRVDEVSGIITTVAGTGINGFSGDGGPATAANLTSVRDVVVDSAGNFWLLDSGNNRIRHVDAASSAINTVAGNGQISFGGDGFAAIGATLNRPFHSVVNAAGNIYITDLANHRIRKVDTSGVITTVAGNGIEGFAGDGGLATNARLGSPLGLAIDGAGNLYFADTNNQRIRKVDSRGVITTVAGNGLTGDVGDGGAATSASVTSPQDVAFDAAGNLYIAQGHRVRRVNTAGTITTVVGDGSCGVVVCSLVGLAVDAIGNVYIAAASRHMVLKFSTSGRLSIVAGTGLQGFSGDGGLAVSAQLNIPQGVAVDAAGNLYIADNNNHRIRKVDTKGVITTVAGTGIFGFSGDGDPSAAARLSFPTGVAVDLQRNLYIADALNHRVRKVLAPPNEPPTANAGPDQTLIVAESGTFNGSGSSDPDGFIEQFLWQFGDGASSSGAVVQHAYTTAGIFTATLTVTDDQGESDSDSDTALITVITAARAIALLADLVASFNLQQGISSSLDAKLQTALDALQAANAGVRQDAANKLHSFISEVEAQRDKKLTSAQADELVALVNRIIGVL